MYLNDNGDYFDLIKKNIIPDSFIEDLIKYNEHKNTNYNVFEFIYLMANGLTGPEPILYKYDLYAFGLILRELVNAYIDALEKNILFDPRKYRAKTKTKNKPTRRPIEGGTIPKTFDYQTRINYKELDEINYVINNMINSDCIYRWSLDDLLNFYQGEEIDTEKFINIKGNMYKLCSEEITRESIVKQFQIINPELKEYVKPEPEPESTKPVSRVEYWRNIEKELIESGLTPKQAKKEVMKMKRKEASKKF